MQLSTKTRFILIALAMVDAAAVVALTPGHWLGLLPALPPLALVVWLSGRNPDAAFYLMPKRPQTGSLRRSGAASGVAACP